MKLWVSAVRFGRIWRGVGGGLRGRVRLAVAALLVLAGALVVWTGAAVASGSKPTNVTAPVVEGEAEVGQLLKATTGEWTGTEPITYEYEWEDCSGGTCAIVSGVTGSSYRVTSGMLGKKLRVTVVAKNSIGHASKASAKTGEVVAGPPVSVERPVVSGIAAEGETLKASAGSWAGSEPIKYAYEWEVCNPLTGCDGEATGETFLLSAADVGDTVRVKVTAENSVGSAIATSEATAEVVGNRPVNTELPKIEGAPEEAATLTANSGKWEGASPITYVYQWETCTSLDVCAPSSGEGAGSAYYRPDWQDAHETLQVTVTATNASGSAHATSVASGEVTTRAGSAAVAWGRNHPSGQLGAGYHDNYEVSPVSVVDLSDITQVAAAGKSSYALLGSYGTIRTWGVNGDESNAKPVPLLEKPNPASHETRELSSASAIAAAWATGTHALAIVDNAEHENQVFTWGAAYYGERGNGEYMYNGEWHETHETEPQPQQDAIPIELTHVIAVAAAGNTDYALQEEKGQTKIWAWGSDKYGLLGTVKEPTLKCRSDVGTPEEACSPTPVEVDLAGLKLPENVKVVAIAGSQHDAYAVLSDHRLVAWGENSYGELGDGTSEASSVPTYVCRVGQGEHACPIESEQLKGVTAVTGGEYFALALLSNGEVDGFGVNGLGQLGGPQDSEQCHSKNGKTCQISPRPVENLKEEPLKEITAVSAAGNYSLALDTNGEVYSFGNNERGQLGNGIDESEEQEKCNKTVPCDRNPTPIKGLEHVVGISAGWQLAGTKAGGGAEGHSLAILKTGTGPEPRLTAEAKEDTETKENALEVRWRTISPEDEYHIKWKKEAPNEAEIEEAKAEAEIDKIAAGVDEKEVEDLLKEAAKAAEPEKKELEEEAEELEEEAEVLNKQVEELTEKAKRLEKEDGEKYPSSASVKITGAKEAYSYTITQAPNEHKENEKLSSESSYQITLISAGADKGDAMMKISARPSG